MERRSAAKSICQMHSAYGLPFSSFVNAFCPVHTNLTFHISKRNSDQKSATSASKLRKMEGTREKENSFISFQF